MFQTIKSKINNKISTEEAVLRTLKDGYMLRTTDLISEVKRQFGLNVYALLLNKMSKEGKIKRSTIGKVGYYEKL